MLLAGFLYLIIGFIIAYSSNAITGFNTESVVATVVAPFKAIDALLD